MSFINNKVKDGSNKDDHSSGNNAEIVDNTTNKNGTWWTWSIFGPKEPKVSKRDIMSAFTKLTEKVDENKETLTKEVGEMRRELTTQLRRVNSIDGKKLDAPVVADFEISRTKPLNIDLESLREKYASLQKKHRSVQADNKRLEEEIENIELLQKIKAEKHEKKLLQQRRAWENERKEHLSNIAFFRSILQSLGHEVTAQSDGQFTVEIVIEEAQQDSIAPIQIKSQPRGKTARMVKKMVYKPTTLETITEDDGEGLQFEEEEAGRRGVTADVKKLLIYDD